MEVIEIYKLAASQQVLTRTLKTLQRDGVVDRTVCATTLPQVEYALTEFDPMS